MYLSVGKNRLFVPINQFPFFGERGGSLQREHGVNNFLTRGKKCMESKKKFFKNHSDRNRRKLNYCTNIKYSKYFTILLYRIIFIIVSR